MAETQNDDWGVPESEDGGSFGDGFDMDDVNEDDVGDNRRKVEKPGVYHFEIADAKERPEPVSDNGSERRPDILLSCVVAESVPGQSPAGSYHYHELRLGGPGGAPIEDWSKKATIAFLYGVGILKKKEVDGEVKFVDPETGTTRINLKTLAKRLKGMQFVGDLKSNTYEKDDGTKVHTVQFPFGRGAYEVDDPTVADVPKNRDALALIGKEGAAPKPADQSAATGGTKKKAAKKKAAKKPEKKPQPETVPADAGAGDGDDFSDL